MSRPSKDCRPRSPSSSGPAVTTRVRRWPPPRRSTTTCGCSSPACGVPHCVNIATTAGRAAAVPSPTTRPPRWSITILHARSGKARSSMVLCARGARQVRAQYKKEVMAQVLQSRGFVRARVNGRIVDAREALYEGLDQTRWSLDRQEATHDRGWWWTASCSSDDVERSRLADSLETALKLRERRLLALVQTSAPDEREDSVLQRAARLPASSPRCQLSRGAQSAACSRSTTPHGACEECDGTGADQRDFFDPGPHRDSGRPAFRSRRGSHRAVQGARSRVALNIYYGRILRGLLPTSSTSIVDKTTPFGQASAPEGQKDRPPGKRRQDHRVPLRQDGVASASAAPGRAWSGFLDIVAIATTESDFGPRRAAAPVHGELAICPEVRGRAAASPRPAA